jgi:hypothetical protein
MLARLERNVKALTLLVGMQNGAAAMKIVGQFFKMFNRVSM